MKTGLLLTITACFFSAVAFNATAVEPDVAAADELLENLRPWNEDPTTIFLDMSDSDGAFAIADPDTDRLAGDIIDYARKFLGRPYRRGSKGPSAFDCSGFTSYVFRNFGYSLSASSGDQYTQGRAVSTDEIRPGDLLFFGGRSSGKNRVGHVGMAVDVDPETGAVTFIHAATSGGIRYDRYPDGGYYSRRYIGARRVL